MNWIRENKFLTGFIAVVAIGAGVLGYLLWTSYGDYSQVSDQYDQEASQLQSLQAQAPYPDQKNLTKYQAERDDLIDATHELATTLTKMVLPVKEMSPSDFQDRLRTAVSGIVAKASRTGVKLPEHFSLDFDRYETEPPRAGAAPLLGRQLAALEIAMNILLDAHVNSIASLKRSVLPEESGGTRPVKTAGPRPGPPMGPRGGPGARAAESENAGNLVEKFPFEIKFNASQPAFQRVLNNFAACSQQFFITRALALENSNPKPVAKQVPHAMTNMLPPGVGPGMPPAGGPGMPNGFNNAPGGGPAAASPPTAGGEEEGAGHLKFIVGTEQLDVIMHVDIVAFNPPEKSTRAAGPGGKAPAH